MAKKSAVQSFSNKLSINMISLGFRQYFLITHTLLLANTCIVVVKL